MVEALVNRKKEEADAHEEGDRKRPLKKISGKLKATIKSHANVFTSSMERALTKSVDRVN